MRGLTVAMPAVQVRMQAEGKLPEGTLPCSDMTTFKPVCSGGRQEGVAGLWKGVGPNIARNAIINAGVCLHLATAARALHAVSSWARIAAGMSSARCR